MSLSKPMNPDYTPTAKVLHWLIALAIFGLLALGFVMTGMPLSPEKLQLYSWHKWAGVSVFVLTWVRLAWRITHPAPPYPESMSAIATVMAHAGHSLLYVLMIVVPLTGWLMSSAKGIQTVWFGVLPIPDLIGKDKALADAFGTAHLVLNWTLLVLVAGHALAALKHHFMDGDDILSRMSPRQFSKNTKESA